MVTPVDAVRYGVGFEDAGRWQKVDAGFIPAERQEEEAAAPVRGAVLGLLLSSVLWVGIIVAVRIVLRLI